MTNRQSSGSSGDRRWVEIDGRQWEDRGTHAVRNVKPGESAPRGSHASYPHPSISLRGRGWRIAIIFFVLPFVCCPLAIVVQHLIVVS